MVSGQRSSGGLSGLLGRLLLAVAAALFALRASSAAADGVAGTTMELYNWAVADPASLNKRSAKAACIVKTFGSALRDNRVFSQVGEDGIIEHIFKCIGPGNKKYVEFGVESGEICGWSILS
jgi:hypothetical protein